MKKVLAAVLAASMTAGISAAAFAAGPASLTLIAKNNSGDYYFDLTNVAPGTEGSVAETIWVYDDEKVEINLITATGEKVRADVNDGKITTSLRKVGTKLTAKKLDVTLGDSASTRDDVTPAYDLYKVVVKSNAGVRDFDVEDWTVELDYGDHSYFMSGKYGYSDVRTVEADGRYSVKETRRSSPEGTTGSIFNFDEPIDEETRISVNQYVDLYFDGNYGTDKENLRVVTDEIEEIADFFEDADVDYYDFIGTPKFAHPVTVLIDADNDAFLYEYDKKTGDITRITDYDYNSDGFKFKTKNLGTYLVTEVEYEGGNLVKEPVKEPVDTEVPDDVNQSSSKPNPGTGAYPIA